MKKRVVLFDFHNTLVTCDAWLELEIRTLAREVLRKLDEDGQLQPRSGDFERADKLFRTLRLQVHESGREVSAVEGAMSVLRDLGYDVAEPEVGRAVAELEQALLPQVEMVQGADRTLILL